jgi:hypothetical protein
MEKKIENLNEKTKEFENKLSLIKKGCEESLS